MVDRDDMSRRYSDQEVGLILRRTAKLQAEAKDAAPPADGLTLAQLEEVAREAGLDPELVKRAAREVEEQQSGRAAAHALLGGRTRIVSEQRVQREISESDMEALIDEIGRALGVAGQASLVGKSLVWSSASPHVGRQVAVTVTSREGVTVLRVEEALDQVAGGLFGGIMGGIGGGGLGTSLGIGLGVFGAPLPAVAIAVGCIGGSYVLARSIFSSVTRSRSTQLHRLANRLAERIADSAPVEPAAAPKPLTPGEEP